MQLILLSFTLSGNVCVLLNMMEHARLKSVENISRDYYSGFSQLWRDSENHSWEPPQLPKAPRAKKTKKKLFLYNLRPGQLYLWLEEISPRLSHWDHLLSVVCPFVLFDPPFLAFALSVPPLFSPSTQMDVKLSSLTRTNTAIRTRSKHSLRRPRSPAVVQSCVSGNRHSGAICVSPLTSSCSQWTLFLHLPRETAHTFVCLLGLVSTK